MNTEKQVTSSELVEKNRKCWTSGCNKTAHFEDWTGWRHCFKHWRMDYKWGRCHGLWQAIKDTKLINLWK